jgi:hypothetical protein
MRDQAPQASQGCTRGFGGNGGVICKSLVDVVEVLGGDGGGGRRPLEEEEEEDFFKTRSEPGGR